jgi:hypothetical protein
MRVIQWHISYAGQINKKIDFLKNFIKKDNCVFVLEEVTENDFKEIEKNIDYNLYYSLNLRKPGKYDAKNRKLGVLIGLSKNLEVKKCNLVKRSLFPERTLFVSFKYNKREVSMLGFHSLTGVDYKKAKSAQFYSIVEFIEKNNLDFLCFDANEPKKDTYNIKDIEFFDQKGDKGKAVSLILGENKIHKLNDSFRLSITKNKEKYFKRSPLETSFIVTGGIEKRYDYIFSNYSWKITSLEYLYKEAILAGSDYALVLGDFK